MVQSKDKKKLAKVNSGSNKIVQKLPKKVEPKKSKWRPSKLLILDLNHVLISRERMSKKFRIRPGAVQFVVRMAHFFKLALWSSAKKDTVRKIIRGLFPDPSKFCPSRFLFVWNQSMCTHDIADENIESDSEEADAREKYYGSAKKPLLRKDLSKVFEKFPEYVGNTLLLDDSPKKGLFNNTKSMVTVSKYTKDVRDNSDDSDSDTELFENSELCQRLEALAKIDGALY